MKLTAPPTRLPAPVTMIALPGPDRKRLPETYVFRPTYRNPAAGEVGCVMTWDVSGGRLPYQVSLERLPGDRLKWHCSCADAVYRGEDDPAHQCKHVRGLVQCLPPLAPPLRRVPVDGVN